MKIAVSISPSTDDDDKELFECTPPYKGEEFLWVTVMNWLIMVMKFAIRRKI